MKNVIVVVGAGGIAQAIARRIGSGQQILVANHGQESADAAAKLLENVGFDAIALQADVSGRSTVQAVVRKAQALGPITGSRAGGGRLALAGSRRSNPESRSLWHSDATRRVRQGHAPGGSGIVISSQSGYRMPALTAEQDALLATAPADQLLALDFVKAVRDTLHTYQMSKRCNSLTRRRQHNSQMSHRFSQVGAQHCHKPLRAPLPRYGR